MRKGIIRFSSILLASLLLLSSCAGNGHKEDMEGITEKITDETSLVSESDGTDASEETENEGETVDLESMFSEVDVDKTYYISTKEELNAVRYGLGENYVLKNEIIFEPSDFEPGGAFYNDGRGWEPIGDEQAPFTGNFNGNGYSVTNLYINMDEEVNEEKSVCASLFGWNEGVIELLTVLNCNISAKADSGSVRSGVYAAGVVGNNIGVVRNCCVSGNIRAELTSSNEKVFVFAGGICGNSFTVENCRNEASVNACMTLSIDKESAIQSETENKPYVGFCYAGGITGSAGREISGCMNVGSVDASSNVINPYGFVYDQVCSGGIAGNLNYSVKVSKCENTKSVNASTTRGLCYAGGIVGLANGGEIELCSNRGDISSRVSSSWDDKCAIAGGICGSSEVSIGNSCNSGNITAETLPSNDNNTEYIGLVFVGGICGGNPYEIVNCYNVGNINAERICEISGVGGISGQIIPEGASGLYYLDNTHVGAALEDFAVRCTDEEMRMAETYEGFDFDNVWEIDPDADYPYPTLK